MGTPFLLLGGTFGFFGVALGAFAAHGLKNHLTSADLEIFKTAALYQLLHALALLAVGLWLQRQPSVWAFRAGLAFALGTGIFCGSLYLLVLTQQRWLGAVTPLGGVSFLAGWAFLTWAAFKNA